MWKLKLTLAPGICSNSNTCLLQHRQLSLIPTDGTDKILSWQKDKTLGLSLWHQNSVQLPCTVHKKNKANPNPSKTKQTKNSRSERSRTEQQQHIIKKNTQVWPTHRKKNERKTEEWCMKDWLPYTDRPHRKRKGLQLEWPRRLLFREPKSKSVDTKLAKSGPKIQSQPAVNMQCASGIYKCSQDLLYEGC